jgi:hypothetical protein
MNTITLMILVLISIIIGLDLHYLHRSNTTSCGGSCTQCNGNCKWVNDIAKAKKDITKNQGHLQGRF